ncbi:tetratricopeptide repeat protein, partial [Streptomyces sp. NPDC004285]
HAHRAAVLQNPHFARNLALYRAHLAKALAHAGRPDEAAAEARRVADSLDGIASARIRGLLVETSSALAGTY